jgi:hypothetical protein
MAATEHRKFDWFRHLINGASDELAVKRIWVKADLLNNYQIGKVFLSEDQDWFVEHIGRGIERAAAGIEHPVYMKAVSSVIELKADSQFI